MLRRTAISLLAGVLSTIAVAWLSALSTNGDLRVDDRYYALDLDAHEVWYQLGATPSVTRIDFLVGGLYHTPTPEPSAPLPHWSFARTPGRFAHYDATTARYIELAHGWPARTMHGLLGIPPGSFGLIPPASPAAISGWPLPLNPANTSDRQVRLLPLQPIWPNFLLSALTLAAAYFALVTSFLTARRALRRRRNRCPSCAYNLTGLPKNAPCPECGDRSPPLRLQS